ncbi:MAG: bifunctional diaminohydroxyphosphoribosylaminopyrimidine deaminase/5-amino-6-(5-phosphoribosylamino)uracil reductase RibD [Planctomycetota bacterium]|nr:bifunctional diaminohydroxyphosphoribosylaminopyrimidine deaminase/5-amino-6-(5-phosphoribosylamino)uracil reductase RibD [Planctomycetota bacterium]
MASSPFDEVVMRRALELASRGRGFVEPNPPVGAVVTRDGAVIGEGWHERFGGPHAEVAALRAAGERARGGTLYVTLEPCCHHGKTPPCTDAIRAAGVTRVVIATGDPFPLVAGRGIAALREAGIDVEVGVLAREAERLTAPFRTLVTRGRPWVIAKWAMSLDGRLTTAVGQGRWISSAESRGLVHDLRTRIDAIAVGIGTALADDPLLTPRPDDAADSGPRRPLRIVLDGRARLSPTSTLVRTAREAPVLVATGPDAPADRITMLEAAGCEVWRGADRDPAARTGALLAELGRRQATHLLVEGGTTLLAGMFAAGQVDEAWTFVAPVIIGGATIGMPPLPAGVRLTIEDVSFPGGDVFVRGTVH